MPGLRKEVLRSEERAPSNPGLDETFGYYDPTAAQYAADAAAAGGYNQGYGAKVTVTQYPAAGGLGIVGGAALLTKGPGASSGGHALEYGSLATTAGIPADSYSVQLWVKSTREVKTTGTDTSDKLHYFFARSQDSNPTMAGMPMQKMTTARPRPSPT